MQGMAGPKAISITTPLIGNVIARLCLAAIAALLAACAQTPPHLGPQNSLNDRPAADADDLYIVDCLLPGQVRSLGQMKYLSARRPIKTTAVDCRIRGGEYVAYDRADYRTALSVWLPQAENGDAEAQNYVGEIFEKGVGGEPDFTAAFAWYKRAALAGNVRAQINLGYLYEQGQGVPRDLVAALNWYRRAAGLDDELVMSSDARQALAAERAKLAAEVKRAGNQQRVLEKRIAELEAQVQGQASGPLTRDPANRPPGDDHGLELVVLHELYAKATRERDSLLAALAQVDSTFRNFEGQALLPELAQREQRVVQDINFGRYFALLIGNQDYLFLDDLRSPRRDTEKLKNILEQRYGFSSVILLDANEKSILNTINDLYAEISDQDNLLIYYAGHGNISINERSRTERGYWLPVDAGSDNISNWINNSVISDHLDRLRARSILVISDSCYAGYLGSAKSPFLFGLSGDIDDERAIKAGLSRRARVVISSGGVKPVIDGKDDAHSIFASALIEALQHNEVTLKDSSLFAQISVNVRKRSDQAQLLQIPEMKPVREAGHEGGTFYFVPTGERPRVARQL